MSTATLGGTFLSYGLSAFLAIGNVYELAFLISGSALVAVCIIWFVSYDKVISKKEKPIAAERMELADDGKKKTEKKLFSSDMLVLIVILGLFAVFSYAISGGLKTWIPFILKETYGLSDSFSVFLGVFLPLCGLLGFVLAELMYRFTGDFVVLTGLSFVVIAVFIFLVIKWIEVSWLISMVLFVLITI